MPRALSSNPASPIVGTASFIVSPISPLLSFHVRIIPSNVVSFQLRQAAFQQLDQAEIIEAPSRQKRIEPLFGQFDSLLRQLVTRDGAAQRPRRTIEDATRTFVLRLAV